MSRRPCHRVLLLVLVALATLLYLSYHLGDTVLLPTHTASLSRLSTDQSGSAPDQRKRPAQEQEAPKAVLSDENVRAIKASIMDPPPPIPKLECPNLNTERYKPLQPQASNKDLTYFFAINLRENLPILPRLLGSLVEVLRFLGPKHCSVSIVEGNSPDGTAEVLEAIGPALRELGVSYHFSQSTINPKQGDRIEGLAALRNLALEPLFSDPRAGKDTTVVFLNDVTACPEDILELVYQRGVQGADMTCAVDWNHNGNPTFYDVWVARTLSGRQFFENPNGTWDLALDLFPSAQDRDAKVKWRSHKPFQVFACWNGVAVFGAAPLLLPDTKHTNISETARGAASSSSKNGALRFRAPREGECKLGEPTLFCKDLWWRGYGKIAVVPTVHVGYSDEGGRKIKELMGYASKLLEKEDKEYRIRWQDEPPERIWCSAPPWLDQKWVPWNETLV